MESKSPVIEIKGLGHRRFIMDRRVYVGIEHQTHIH